MYLTSLDTTVLLGRRTVKMTRAYMPTEASPPTRAERYGG